MGILKALASFDLLGAVRATTSQGDVLLYPLANWPGKRKATQALQRAGIRAYNIYAYPTSGEVRIACSDPQKAADVLDRLG